MNLFKEATSFYFTMERASIQEEQEIHCTLVRLKFETPINFISPTVKKEKGIAPHVHSHIK